MKITSALSIIIVALISIVFVSCKIQNIKAPELKFTSAPTASPEPPKETIESTSYPILMYHHVKNCDENCDDIEQGLSVSNSDFEAQMKYLSDNGYKTIFLDDLFYKSDAKTLALTFDDGYLDNLSEAAPILKKYNLSATLFVICDSVGTDRYLNWEQIKQLSDQNWQIGAHTKTHPNLTTLSKEDMEDQIASCKTEIEKNIGKPVKFFSYPAGKFDDTVISVVKDSGFSGAVTTVSGTKNNKNNPFELKRLRINGSDSLDGFIYKVSE